MCVFASTPNYATLMHAHICTQGSRQRALCVLTVIVSGTAPENEKTLQVWASSPLGPSQALSLLREDCLPACTVDSFCTLIWPCVSQQTLPNTQPDWPETCPVNFTKVCCLFLFSVLFCFLGDRVTMSSWLSWNSLCKLGWLQTRRALPVSASPS